MVDGNAQACGTYHWQTTWPAHNCSYPSGHESVSKCAPLAEGWGETYHEFAVEHTAEYLAFLVDGKVRRPPPPRTSVSRIGAGLRG